MPDEDPLRVARARTGTADSSPPHAQKRSQGLRGQQLLPQPPMASPPSGATRRTRTSAGNTAILCQNPLTPRPRLPPSPRLRPRPPPRRLPPNKRATRLSGELATKATADARRSRRCPVARARTGLADSSPPHAQKRSQGLRGQQLLPQRPDGCGTMPVLCTWSDPNKRWEYAILARIDAEEAS